MKISGTCHSASASDFIWNKAKSRFGCGGFGVSLVLGRLRMRLQNQNMLSRTEEGGGVNDGVGCNSKDGRADPLLSNRLAMRVRRWTIVSCGSASSVLWDSTSKAVTTAEKRPAFKLKLQASSDMYIVRNYFKTFCLLKYGQ